MVFRWKVPAGLTAAVVVLGLALASTAFATRPPDHKVTICHATNSDTTPYVQIDVDIASSGYLHAGHNDHAGPIWYEGAKDAKVAWGDIIPPYDYAPTTFHFDGLNWTDAGQTIWNNDCAMIEVTASPSFEQSQAPVTEVPSFGQSVEAVTEVPTEPNTSTDVGATARPDGGANILLLLFAAALVGVVTLTPRTSRRAGR